MSATYITKAPDDWTPSLPGELLPREVLIATLRARRAAAAQREVDRIRALPLPPREHNRFQSTLPLSVFLAALPDARKIRGTP